MKVAIVAFDDFTDVDVFLMWDLLKRADAPDWSVRILGSADHHVSSGGLRIPMHGRYAEAGEADAVLFTSGYGTRAKHHDPAFLGAFQLDPQRQLIGSMCSGALILAGLGLLKGRKATTYPSVAKMLGGMGVEVVEQPFVVEGNVATAAGCLAAQRLAGWVIERLIGPRVRDLVLKSVQPVGEGLSFADADISQRIHVAALEETSAAASR